MNNGQSLAWLGMFRVYRCVWGPIPPGSTRLNYKQPWWEPLWTHQDLRKCKCYNGFSWIFEHCSHSETAQLLDNSVWWSHHGRDKSFVPRPRQRHQTVRTCREHSSLRALRDRLQRQLSCPAREFRSNTTVPAWNSKRQACWVRNASEKFSQN